MLKRKVGNCCIQRTEPIEQKTLFDKGNSWMKEGRHSFDKETGADDDAEAYKLFNQNLDLTVYRDDGLSSFRNKNGKQVEK